MKCKDVEHLLLDYSWDDLGRDQTEKMHQHISCCASCARFEDDLKKIRMHLQEVQPPFPSIEFLERTRKLCHARLNNPSIPRYIWAALTVLLGLTGVLMLPLGRELFQGQSLSVPSVGMLILMIQNLAMLVFAPVLIHRFKLGKKDDMNGSVSSGPHQAY
jgi:hypothetical protein